MKRWLVLPLLLASVVAACQDGPEGMTAPSERSLAPAVTLANPQIDFHHGRRPVPPGEGITLRASANATAQYVCVNKAGRCPAAAKKRVTTSGLVSVTETFFASADSLVRGSLILGPPPPPARLCGKGQTPTLTTVSYRNASFVDVTNNVVLIAFPEPAEGTFFTCP